MNEKYGPTAKRVVVGDAPLLAAIKNLTAYGVWFAVEADEDSTLTYTIHVYPCDEPKLPALKNWGDALDVDVMDLARRTHGTDPDSNGEVFIDDEAVVVHREVHGAWVTGQIFVPYPKDEA